MMRQTTFPILLLIISVVNIFSAAAEMVSEERHYNEVQYRVLEKVSNFMNLPVFALDIINDMYKFDGFPNGLEAPDRDRAMQQMYSIIYAHQRQSNSSGLRIYYGMESGLFLGYTSSAYDIVPALSYREPGNGGYDPVNDYGMQRYWNICVNRVTGQKETCQLKKGSSYVSCDENNCNDLVKCPDSDSQKNCSIFTGNDQEMVDCESKVKWCKVYSIKKVDDDYKGSSMFGYVPRGYSCINSKGSYAKAPGESLTEVFNAYTNSAAAELGDCTFESGEIVTRKISGPYEYCQDRRDNSSIADGFAASCTTYTGVYRTDAYDPRYRGWYIDVKEKQHPRWSDPYVFFSKDAIGITYAQPLFSAAVDGRHIFVGVLGADYFLSDITNFLVEAYNSTDVIVGIYEDAEPHNIIALSTGSTISKKVLTGDHSQPCLVKDGEQEQNLGDDKCEVIRMSINDLQFSSEEGDRVINNAHFAFADEGYDYDGGDIISIKAGPEDLINSVAYSGSSFVFEQSTDSNLKWRIVVVRRMERDPENSILKGEGLYSFLCIISATGFLLCVTLFVTFYRKRKYVAVKLADMRFTSAFILGCASLNLSILTLSGENTSKNCMLRMWVFHMLNAIALSPLFVKTYRAWKLMGSESRIVKKQKMTNCQAWVRTLPIPLLQAYILLVFTFLDPPEPIEEINTNYAIPMQQIHCEHKSNAFNITESTFLCFLISIGCILSYTTRNVSSKISDSKALLFAMYNVAFSTLMVTCINIVVDLEERGQIVMQAIGIFWATVFSSAAFVIPRLINVKSEKQHKRLTMSERRQSALSSRPKRDSHTCSDDEDEEQNVPLNILVCSANLGNAKPTSKSMAAWIPPFGLCDNVTPLEGKSFQSTQFDLIVIGMQESTWSTKKGPGSANDSRSCKSLQNQINSRPCQYLKSQIDAKLEMERDAEMNYLASVEGEDAVALRAMISDTLGKSYMPVAEESRGEMRLYIYGKNEVGPFLEDIEVTGANTGVGNVLANKGGIIISFNYMKTRFTFLSAHLAAHEGQTYYQGRCENIRDILRSSNTNNFGQPYYDSTISSHHMFVLGDLNFRTVFRKDGGSRQDDVERATKLIHDKDFDTLYSFDELHKGIASGDLLTGFRTLPCTFHPTFKVQRKPGFVYNGQRTPSYTDRIVFKSASGLETKLKALAYEPCVDFITSDHKPVRGAFSIVPNEKVQPVNLRGKIRFKFHEIAGSDLKVGDLDGSSDPYVMVVWDGINMKTERPNRLQTFLPQMLNKYSFPRTPYKRKTLNPKWIGKEISLVSEDSAVGAEAMLFVVVMDYDFAKQDDWLGTLPLSVKELISILDGSGEKEVSFDRLLQRYGKNAGRIKFKLNICIE